MKAYSLKNVEELLYEELDVPEIPDEWALVKVKAAGICSSDIPRIFSKGTYNFPTIPGHEFSGIVEKVANEKNEHLLGAHVGVFPLIPCRKCQFCRSHHYEMCENYDYIGSRRDGGFAEYVAVPVWNLITLPNDVSFEDAAMLEPLAVALHAVKSAQIVAGYSVAIVGTGMIGFATAQWAKMLGASHVTVVGRSEEKRAFAIEINVDYEIINNLKLEYDVVVEAVGSQECINRAISITKPGGRLVLMGNPSGDIVLGQNIYWRILRKQLNIVGTWNSSYEHGAECDWSYAVDALKDGSISVRNLITHIYEQDQLMEGLNMMKNHKEMYCKVMTIWNRSDEK